MSTDQAEVRTWENQAQSLYEEEKRLTSTKMPVLPGPRQDEPAAAAAWAQGENGKLNQTGAQERKTSPCKENAPGSFNPSTTFRQPLTSRAEVCPWEFESPDGPSTSVDRGVVFPVSSGLQRK